MPKPIRVINYVAYPQRMAGANRMVLELVSGLPKDEVETLVVFAGEGRAVDAFREAGIATHVLPIGPSLGQYGKAMLRWSAARRLRVALRELVPYMYRLHKLIRDYGADLVQINDARGALLLNIAPRLTGRPVIAQMHGEVPFSGLPRRNFEWIPDRIVCVSHAVRNQLSPSAQSKAHVIHYGSEDVSYKGKPVPWLQRLRQEGVAVACCFASVTPFKGHSHLLEAVADLNRRGWKDRAVFVCVGDLMQEHRSYQEWLFKEQRRLSVTNLLFTGWQDDPYSFYRTADLTVLPSFNRGTLHIEGEAVDVRGNEGLPVTNAEAMWFGLPIVAADNAGIAEQVEDGLNGVLVPMAQPAALADALECLLADAELRERMGRAGRERVERLFSKRAYTDGVLRLYQELVHAS